jgi:hypothetical protein
MIAQTMALSNPRRVLSLTSIMSSTGRRTVGWQDPRLLPMLLARRARSRDHYVEASAKLWKLIGSPLYPDTVEAVRQRAGETWDRGVTPAGVARQIGAILTQPDRSRTLRSLRIPSLVIHGTQDRMVHVSGGRATSQAIPGSELLLIPGMGHDVPAVLHETFVEAIRRTADRAADRIDRIDRADRADRIDRVDRIDGVDRVDRIDGVDRVDRIDRADRVDRIDGVDRVDQVDHATQRLAPAERHAQAERQAQAEPG